MSEAPSWGKLLEMLEEFSKVSHQVHDSLHPLFQGVGENKDRLNLPVGNWTEIEGGLLRLLHEMEGIVTAHLQIHVASCSSPLTPMK